MKGFLQFCLVLCLVLTSCNAPLTGEQLLERSIAYHDPQGQWETFYGQLRVTMETPNQSDRISDITINLPEAHFYVKAVRDTLTTVYDVKQDRCHISFNGRTEFTPEEAATYRLNCETAKRYRDYYTYLYGLPMKLKDPGTIIHETVEEKMFKEKHYLVLKATYDAEVGTDVWYFYFDPESYAMEVYQFYKTDEQGNLKPDSGEYILLSGDTEINGIKIPKIRAWYYNKNDEYLGTDILD